MRIEVLTALLLTATSAWGQTCSSAALQSREAFLFGRFEVRMRSAEGAGLVSSFFLYNRDVNCNWPAVNNEIDIEMIGNLDASVQFTTHYPFLTAYTYVHPVGFNPHADFHDYAIEWTPEAVRWFVDGALAYVQDAPYVGGLQHPMRIMMNLWAADAPDWVGEWTGAMPVTSAYDRVACYAYTPEAATEFTLQWEDEFTDGLDADRWETQEMESFSGNFCTFSSASIAVEEGEMTFELSEPLEPAESEVTFRLDAGTVPAAGGDLVYLNGTFNNWCGTCEPMTLIDGVYTATRMLPTGVHEFLFTVNGWGQIGGAPLGSTCDALPCDEYGNYGVFVPYDGTPVATPVHCWSSCLDCTTCPADVSGDGFVTLTDVLSILSSFGCQGNCPGDISADYVVSIADLLLLLNAFGEPCD